MFSEDLEERKKVARELRTAVVRMGFFYLKTHGIPVEIIHNCRRQTLAFFWQPMEKKELAGRHLSRFYNGYFAARSTNVNPLESIDVKESFVFRYEPQQHDAPPKDPTAVPQEVRPYIRGEEFVWDGTVHLPGFKEGALAYWQACLLLARGLVRDIRTQSRPAGGLLGRQGHISWCRRAFQLLPAQDAAGGRGQVRQSGQPLLTHSFSPCSDRIASAGCRC